MLGVMIFLCAIWAAEVRCIPSLLTALALIPCSTHDAAAAGITLGLTHSTVQGRNLLQQSLSLRTKRTGQSHSAALQGEQAGCQVSHGVGYSASRSRW